MAYPESCQRLRLGGSVSGSTISGGTVIESGAINLVAWDGLLGLPAHRGQLVRIPSVDGALWPSEPLPWDARIITLGLYALNRDEDLLITDPDGKEGELSNNIDTLLGLFLGRPSGANEGLVTLERDLPDGSTRFLRFWVTGAAPLGRGPIFGSDFAAYNMAVTGECPNPFWQSETEYTTAIGTGTALAGVGNAPVVEMDIEFGGAARVTDDVRNDYVEASGACTVQLRRTMTDRRIQSGGSPSDNLVTRNRDWFLRVYPGTTLTRTGGGAVSIVHRAHWF